MKKKIFAIPILVLAFALPLFACDTKGGNTSNGNDGLINNNKPIDTTEKNEIDNTITDWESSGIFAAKTSEYKFDFSYEDIDFSYVIGSEESEELFARILSGEEDYRDYFGWFSMNPEYIYRLNIESYRAVAEIIKEGAFTQRLRDKYFGLFTTNTNYPYFSACGLTTESYQIYINDDWSIDYIRKSVQYDIQCDELDGELSNYFELIYPCYEEQHLTGYRLTFASLGLKVDMGDGKKADCSVDATYNTELITEDVWNAQKQDYEEVTYLSQCRVMADDNNGYSGDSAMFDYIFILTKQSGEWNLFKVWEQYREEALIPSVDKDETHKQNIFQLA